MSSVLVSISDLSLHIAKCSPARIGTKLENLGQNTEPTRLYSLHLLQVDVSSSLDGP